MYIKAKHWKTTILMAMNPITYRGGGGGFLSSDYQIIDSNFKTAHPSISKLLVAQAHFGRILRKSVTSEREESRGEGVAAVVFELRPV